MKRLIGIMVIMCLLMSACGKKEVTDGKIIEGALEGASQYKYEGTEYTDAEKDKCLQQMNKTILRWYIPDSAAMIDPTVVVAINNRLQDLKADYCVDFIFKSDINYTRIIDEELKSANTPDIITTGYAGDGESNRVYYAYINGWLETLGSLDDKESFVFDMPKFMYVSSAVDGKIIGLGSKLPLATNYCYSISSKLALANNGELSGKDVKITEFEKVFNDSEGDEKLFFINNEKLYADGYIDGVANYRNVVNGEKYHGLIINCNSGEVCNLFEDEYAIEFFKNIRKLKEGGHIASNIEDANILVHKCNYRDNLELSMDGNVFDDELTHILESRSVRNFANCAIVSQESVTGICQKSNNKELATGALTTIMNDKVINNYLLYGIPGRDCTSKDYFMDCEYREGAINYYGNPFAAIQDSHYQSEVELKDYYSEMPCYQYRYVDLSDYAEKLTKQEEIVNEYIGGLLSGEYEDVENTLMELNDRLYDSGLKEVIAYINGK